MLTENDLRELLDFSAAAPVLSLYLNTDPSEGNTDAHKLRARSMIKDINLPQDVEAMIRYLDHEYNWSGRGVAIFSCAPAGFLRAYPVGVPVRSAVHISDKPSVKILSGLLDNYGGHGVVLIDKQGARLFHFHLGVLVEQEGVVGEAVKHVKRGGSSSLPGRRGGSSARGMDEQVDRNMKDAVDFAVHFFESKKIRRIIIGGTDENVKQFRGLLPKAWQSLVVGSFAISLTANPTEVQARALEVSVQAEERREADLVDNLLNSAAKQSSAVTGLAETLDAANQGRVQLLVVTEGLRKVGYRAKENGALVHKLPAGDEDGFEKVYDVVDLAVNAVMRSGGEIEVVSQNAALDKAGSIGAILRY